MRRLSQSPPGDQHLGRRWSWAPVLIGLSLVCGAVANLLVFSGVRSLDSIPVGTEIRPMGLGVVLLMADVTAYLLGIPFGVAGIVVSCRAKRWRAGGLGLVAVAACALPHALFYVLLQAVVHERRLIFSQ